MAAGLPVLVAGGGIGGMAAALTLARAGLRVTVLEQAPAPAEVGAGLQLGPNATRLLIRHGLGAELAAAGFAPEAAAIRDGRTGRVLVRMALGRAAEDRWRAPYLQLHRADLLALLAGAAGAAGAEIRNGARVSACREEGETVAVDLATGVTLRGRALVGADGIASTVRAALHGPGRPRFTGEACWRATLPAAALPPGLVAPEATIWAGPDGHVVTYLLRGGSLVNLVAVTALPGWEAEGWSEPGEPARLRAAFAGWHGDVTRLLDRVAGCTLWAFRAIAPLPFWRSGRIALLGDACHPMLPYFAQGAAMAIEDAAVLARCLADHPVPAALARYETLRRGRATRVQHASARNGRLFHARGPARHLAFAPLALATRLVPAALPRAFDWLYGFDAEAGG
jgi:salicylate hydroxylase